MSHPTGTTIACDECHFWRYLDENENEVLECGDCEQELCRSCRNVTGHFTRRESQEGEAPVIGCPPGPLGCKLAPCGRSGE